MDTVDRKEITSVHSGTLGGLPRRWGLVAWWPGVEVLDPGSCGSCEVLDQASTAVRFIWQSQSQASSFLQWQMHRVQLGWNTLRDWQELWGDRLV